MIDRILYIISNMSSVPWESAYAAVAPSTPSRGYSHLYYRGYGERQVGWHGETYCVLGSYRSYGDLPLATPAKREVQQLAPRRAPKRRHPVDPSDLELGCPRAKKPRLQLEPGRGEGTSGEFPLLAPAELLGEMPAPRRALKRRHAVDPSDLELGCPRPKKPRLELEPGTGDGTSPESPLAAPAELHGQKPEPRRAPKRRHPVDPSDLELGSPKPKRPRL
ncbi:skin secretory protein xP2-like [Suncus etruscus]|uniref:skin secretory protein xP2-like n=1 Tax=Suncus etruscus TaxID=109475 RepID=UPI00210FF41F|nr:skin secretory protein xP2-like [Suncus etruscus]